MKPGREGQIYEALVGVEPADEPVFILRAQDRCAAAAVRHWAMLNENAGGDPALTAQARGMAAKMEGWPNRKLADLERREPAPPAPGPVPEGKLVGETEAPEGETKPPAGETVSATGDAGSATPHKPKRGAR